MKCVTVDLTLSSDDEKPPQIRSKSLKSAQPAAKLGAKSTPASLSGGKSNAGGKEAEKREMWGEPLASSSNRRRSAQGDSSDEMDLDQEQNHDDSFSATDSRLAPSHQSHPASRNSTTMQSQHVPLPHSTRFWEPSIREAYNRFHGVGLKLSDLCGDLAKLQRVILSSYCLDQDWVLGHFVNHLGIKVLLVHPDFSEYRKPGDVRYQEGTNWSWVVPAFAGRNTNGKDKENGLYHVKFIVLVFDTFTRVVITSANMMHYDWSDIGNSIVVQDFPFLPPTSATPKSPADNPTHSPMFSLPLCQLFERFQIPGPFLEFFGRCDWTESGRDDSMRLVVCNSGTWVGWEEMEKGGGLLSLANAVEDCGFEEEGTWEVEAAGSSIINYSYSWLTYFHACASSLSPRTFLTPASALLTRETAPSLSLSILWHSLDYVKRSVNGVDGGGTMFSKGQNDFELTGEYKFRNKGKGGFISHTKSILAIHNPSPTSTSTEAEGYLYIGSANLTATGAWGELTPSSTPFSSPKLHIKNAELGVLLPFRAETMEELQEMTSGLVGYVRPVERFDLAKGELGWHQHEYRRGEHAREKKEKEQRKEERRKEKARRG